MEEPKERDEQRSHCCWVDIEMALSDWSVVSREKK